jgi:hypothetical protein
MPTWRGTTSTDWNTGSNWDTLTVPDLGTDAIFDALSSAALFQCTTGNAARSCRDLITTGFTGTLTIGSTSAGFLNVFRNVILGTAPNHLNPTVSLAAINMRTSGTTITSASSAAIVPEITNQNVSQTFNLVGTISILRFFPVGGTIFNSSTAGTFIEIVNGGNLQGNGGAGTNVTIRINGSCTIGSVGYSTRGPHILASGSTLTMNGVIDVNGVTASFDFSPGTLVPGTQLFRMQNAFTNVTLNMGTNSFYDATLISTLILQSNLNITRNLILSSTTNLGGAFDITVGGNLTGTSILNGTNNRKIRVTGTATGTSTVTNFSFGGNAAGITYTLEIDCGSNNFVMTGTTVVLGGGTAVINYLTSNSGSFTATSSILAYSSGNLTLSMIGRGSSYSFGTLQNPNGVTRVVTLLSNVYFQTIGNTTSGDNWNGVGHSIYVSGSVGLTRNLTGTSTLRFIGSSNATWTVVATSTISLFAFAFERTGGTLDIPNSFIYTGTGGITWTSGAINHTSTLTLGTTTLATSSAGMSWNNLTINAASTITITQPLSIVNTLALSASVTFAGTAGWTCGTLTCSTPAAIIVLQSGITYTTVTNVIMLGTDANKILMRSSAPTTIYAIWTLQNPAAQSMVYVSATAIDSSLGMTIYSFGGIISAAAPVPTLNWGLGAAQGTKAFTFVN